MTFTRGMLGCRGGDDELICRVAEAPAGRRSASYLALAPYQAGEGVRACPILVWEFKLVWHAEYTSFLSSRHRGRANIGSGDLKGFILVAMPRKGHARVQPPWKNKFLGTDAYLTPVMGRLTSLASLWDALALTASTWQAWHWNLMGPY